MKSYLSFIFICILAFGSGLCFPNEDWMDLEEGKRAAFINQALSVDYQPYIDKFVPVFPKMDVLESSSPEELCAKIDSDLSYFRSREILQFSGLIEAYATMLEEVKQNIIQWASLQEIEKLEGLRKAILLVVGSGLYYVEGDRSFYSFDPRAIAILRSATGSTILLSGGKFAGTELANSNTQYLSRSSMSLKLWLAMLREDPRVNLEEITLSVRNREQRYLRALGPVFFANPAAAKLSLLTLFETFSQLAKRAIDFSLAQRTTRIFDPLLDILASFEAIATLPGKFAKPGSAPGYYYQFDLLAFQTLKESIASLLVDGKVDHLPAPLRPPALRLQDQLFAARVTTKFVYFSLYPIKEATAPFLVSAVLGPVRVTAIRRAERLRRDLATSTLPEALVRPVTALYQAVVKALEAAQSRSSTEFIAELETETKNLLSEFKLDPKAQGFDQMVSELIEETRETLKKEADSLADPESPRRAKLVRNRSVDGKQSKSFDLFSDEEAAMDAFEEPSGGETPVIRINRVAKKIKFDVQKTHTEHSGLEMFSSENSEGEKVKIQHVRRNSPRINYKVTKAHVDGATLFSGKSSSESSDAELNSVVKIVTPKVKFSVVKSNVSGDPFSFLDQPVPQSKSEIFPENPTIGTEAPGSKSEILKKVPKRKLKSKGASTTNQKLKIFKIQPAKFALKSLKPSLGSDGQTTQAVNEDLSGTEISLIKKNEPSILSETSKTADEIQALIDTIQPSETTQQSSSEIPTDLPTENPSNPEDQPDLYPIVPGLPFQKKIIRTKTVRRKELAARPPVKIMKFKPAVQTGNVIKNKNSESSDISSFEENPPANQPVLESKVNDEPTENKGKNPDDKLPSHKINFARPKINQKKLHSIQDNTFKIIKFIPSKKPLVLEKFEIPGTPTNPDEEIKTPKGSIKDKTEQKTNSNDAVPSIEELEEKNPVINLKTTEINIEEGKIEKFDIEVEDDEYDFDRSFESIKKNGKVPNDKLPNSRNDGAKTGTQNSLSKPSSRNMLDDGEDEEDLEPESSHGSRDRNKRKSKNPTKFYDVEEENDGDDGSETNSNSSPVKDSKDFQVSKSKVNKKAIKNPIIGKTSKDFIEDGIKKIGISEDDESISHGTPNMSKVLKNLKMFKDGSTINDNILDDLSDYSASEIEDEDDENDADDRYDPVHELSVLMDVKKLSHENFDHVVLEDSFDEDYEHDNLEIISKSPIKQDSSLTAKDRTAILIGEKIKSENFEDLISETEIDPKVIQLNSSVRIQKSGNKTQRDPNQQEIEIEKSESEDEKEFLNNFKNTLTPSDDKPVGPVLLPPILRPKLYSVNKDASPGRRSPGKNNSAIDQTEKNLDQSPSREKGSIVSDFSEEEFNPVFDGQVDSPSKNNQKPPVRGGLLDDLDISEILPPVGNLEKLDSTTPVKSPLEGKIDIPVISRLTSLKLDDEIDSIIDDLESPIKDDLMRSSIKTGVKKNADDVSPSKHPENKGAFNDEIRESKDDNSRQPEDPKGGKSPSKLKDSTIIPSSDSLIPDLEGNISPGKSDKKIQKIASINPDEPENDIISSNNKYFFNKIPLISETDLDNPIIDESPARSPLTKARSISEIILPGVVRWISPNYYFHDSTPKAKDPKSTGTQTLPYKPITYDEITYIDGKAYVRGKKLRVVLLVEKMDCEDCLKDEMFSKFARRFKQAMSHDRIRV